MSKDSCFIEKSGCLVGIFTFGIVGTQPGNDYYNAAVFFVQVISTLVIGLILSIIWVIHKDIANKKNKKFNLRRIFSAKVKG